jgi:hypothetical protein
MIGNLNAILRSVCGRTPTGDTTACIHDHIGEATGIYNLVKIDVLRTTADELGGDEAAVLREQATEIQEAMTP